LPPRQGLLDELDLLLFPVVGRGKRLFSGRESSHTGLTLARSEAFPTGMVHMTYHPASS
jgi:hypothetical protein